MNNKELEKQLNEIKKRNQRVELDKKWETSYTRRIFIMLITYFVVVIYSVMIQKMDSIWLSYALIDTGFLSREHAISIVEDRTNHKNDSLIEDFWYHYNEYSFIDDNKKNVETARDLGMIGEVVTPDSYSSVYDVLEKNKINV